MINSILLQKVFVEKVERKEEDARDKLNIIANDTGCGCGQTNINSRLAAKVLTERNLTITFVKIRFATQY